MAQAEGSSGSAGAGPAAPPLEGGCNCGAIRYQIGSPPMQVVACHCTNCRRQSGAAFSVNLVVAADALSVAGDLATYEDRATESGRPVMRDFCGTCGSPIMSRITASPGIVAVKAGTLDAPDAYAPAVHIWTETALDWVVIPEGLPTRARSS